MARKFQLIISSRPGPVIALFLKILYFRSKRAIPILLFVLAVNIIILAPARSSDRDDDLFNYERFRINVRVLEELSDSTIIQKDIARFSALFSKGIDAFSHARTDESIDMFILARKIWPEYFGADFMLGLAYEKAGKIHEAAFFYQSYLDKLRRFYAGRYGLSAPMIRSLMSYPAKPYPEAVNRIKERFAEHDINIPSGILTRHLPRFIITTGMILVIVLIAGAVKIRVLPALKKRHDIKNPPEGFWGCTACGSFNPILARECYGCGRKKE